MRKILVGTMMLVGLGAVAGSAEAQGFFPLAVEVRGGAGFPVGDFGDGVNTGWGFDANAQLRVAPMLSLYAGYGTIDFDSSDEGGLLGSGSGTVTDQGFHGGAMLSLPTGMLLGVSPYLRAGALYHEAKFDFENDDSDMESEKNLGYEVGAGLTFPLGLVVSFTPEVKYRSYAPEWDNAFGSEDDEKLSYVMVDLGLKFSF